LEIVFLVLGCKFHGTSDVGVGVGVRVWVGVETGRRMPNGVRQRYYSLLELQIEELLGLPLFLMVDLLR